MASEFFIDETPGANVSGPGIIAHFKPGSPRTLLSASEANRVVRACNKFTNLTVGPGLKIVQSDAGIRIVLEDESD